MTAASPSMATFSWVSTGAPELRAYGDADDHLRLTVLLSQVLEQQGGSPEAGRACRERRQPWKQRLAALRELLRSIPTGGQVTLVDPDALHTGASQTPGARWDDATFRAERDAFLRTLLQEAGRGAWTLIRPAPRTEVSEWLRDAGIESEQGPSPTSEGEEPLLSLVGLELRPILSWLLRSDLTDRQTAAELIEAASGGDPAPEVVTLAYDALRPSVRETARRLGLLRPAQPLNGSLGPYRLGADPAPDAIRRDHLESLLAAGFLQPVPTRPDLLRVPRTVRQHLGLRARLIDPMGTRTAHAWLAERGEESTADELERHHHAVHSAKTELARRTARFYGADLRHVGFVLSHEGRRRIEAYTEAAAVYELIVSEFDPADAYAWEYLGFNLDRSCAAADRRVLDAYHRAVELEPSNPLYRGRLIGFRARLGEQVEGEIRHWIEYYAMSHGPSGASYFALPVYNQLRQAGLHEQAHALRSRWPVFTADAADAADAA